MKYAAVFATMFVMELVSTLWVLGVAERSAIAAAVSGSSLELMRMFLVVQYVKDWRMAFPVGAGSMLGIWTTVTFL